MNEILTFRQLLEKYPNETVPGNLLGIDADLPIDEAVLAVLKTNPSIKGLEAITSEDKSLGVISRTKVVLYLKEQSIRNSRRGGRVGQLEGSIVAEMPKYECTKHDPPYPRLVAIARSEPPKCPICDEFMEYIG